MQRKVGPDDARRWLDRLLADGVLARVQVEGDKDQRLVLAADLPLLHTLEANGVPEAWRSLGPSTDEETVLLAPLDIVSARGRAAWLFGFDYIWEVYKPAEAPALGLLHPARSIPGQADRSPGPEA